MLSDNVPSDLTPAYPVSIPDEGVRAKLLELLGLETLPEHCDFTVESEEKADDGITQTRLYFANVLGETVPGMLLTPPDCDGHSRPGVVCLPGTSGDAEQVTDEHFHRESLTSGPLFGWGRELARRGFVTLSVTVMGTEKRRGDFLEWEREETALGAYGRSQMGLIVDETLRAARILGSREAVDPRRIGLGGMSLGGNGAWYAMACALWIRTAAVVCGGVGSMARVIHEIEDPGRHSSYFFVPHMLRFFDHPRIVTTCIAPRPFMAVAPTRDEDMPSTGVDDLLQEATPVYASAGVPEAFKVHRPETNHVFMVEFFEWMVEWFRKYL